MLNENYTHPAIPEGAQEGICKGLYLFREGGDGQHSVQLMGSGAILREVIAAADILERDYSVSATVWSATSFTELQRDGIDAARYNRRNPELEQQTSWVAQCLDGRNGPVVAATDYVRAFAEQIRPYLPQSDYTVLGTDGYGRSDTHENLRRFFEVDRNNVTYTALHALSKQGLLSVEDLVKARDALELDPAKPNPSGV